jgi:predicted nucleotide-binding protein (sugar kinase/HSP70/actin superfamily)
MAGLFGLVLCCFEVSKGIEKKLRMLYPELNLLSLDFDSGVSSVNVTNRLLLFTHNLSA